MKYCLFLIVLLGISINGLGQDPAYGKFEPLNQWSNIPTAEERLNFDNLFHSLSENAKYTGIIILEFEPGTKAGTGQKQIKRIADWAIVRKTDLSRLTFWLAEADREQTTLLLLAKDSDLIEKLSKGYETINAANLKHVNKK